MDVLPRQAHDQNKITDVSQSTSCSTCATLRIQGHATAVEVNQAMNAVMACAATSALRKSTPGCLPICVMSLFTPCTVHLETLTMSPSDVRAVVPALVPSKSGARNRRESMALRVSCLRSHVQESDEL